ncbi:MAG: hypothetical protein ABIB71_09240 [Candidatus Woesearchaeota archaeon]
MDDLLDLLMRKKKLTVEQSVELLLGYSKNPDEFEKQLEPIDTGIHLAHAVKSGMCFPYFATMLLHDKAVAFKLDEEEISNYPHDDFGKDVEQCTHLRYLTAEPCFYFEHTPKVALQEPGLERLPYRERIAKFSPANSYGLGCIVNVRPYGLQSKGLSLPAPLDSKGNEIMVLWLEDLEKTEAPFQLEARHHARFKSFFNVPGLEIYYPIHNFGDTKERYAHELGQFQKYLAEKVEPRLGKMLSV